MKNLILAAMILNGCGSDSDSEVKELPIFPLDVAATGYKKVGWHGSCDAAIKVCKFSFELKESCTHGSFILYLIRSHYAYTWIISDDKAEVGSWTYKITSQPKAVQDLGGEYRESIWTLYRCLDSEISTTGG